MGGREQFGGAGADSGARNAVYRDRAAWAVAGVPGASGAGSVRHPDPGRGGGLGGIYFVEPNIARVAAKAGVDLEGLRLWVALHEATHAYQFRVGDPPWLRGYTAGLIQDYLAEAIAALESGEGLGERLRDMWRRFEAGDSAGTD